jgi:transglutaminase-like putative cysteine protease
MSWRIEVRHSSGYRYAEPVRASYNEARITPLSTPQQTTIHSQVVVAPGARTYRYWDYWGTLVHAFELHDPHGELTVVGTSTVETGMAPPGAGEATWAELEAVADRFAEHLEGTDHVPLDEEVATWAHEVGSGTPAEVVRATVCAVADRLSYVPGATGVSTSAVDAFHQREGVCQDFAHLALAALRSHGIPARYVSGYLHPRAGADIGETVVGQSHAWVEAWLGDWVPVDPTNGSTPESRHVVVARGRDYADVSPLRGIYSGGKAERLAVSVELTRRG